MPVVSPTGMLSRARMGARLDDRRASPNGQRGDAAQNTDTFLKERPCSPSMHEEQVSRTRFPPLSSANTLMIVEEG